MKKNQKDKTMKVKIVGTNKKVGVMIDGEVHLPGDVAEVGLLTGKSLIARGRAVKADAKKKKAKSPAKDSGKDSGKTSE